MNIVRHMTYTRGIHAAFAVAGNGASFADIAARVASGDLALYEHDGAFAAVSYHAGEICIEAVEGRGGLRLVRVITDAAKRMDCKAVGWVYNAARVRMVRFLGYSPTGEVRECTNGVLQYKVAA
jgi:hypothetical protein